MSLFEDFPDDSPCVFCHDTQINHFMARGTPTNMHKTVGTCFLLRRYVHPSRSHAPQAPCLHRVCGSCEKLELSTPKNCPKCSSRIVASSLSLKPPSILRLDRQTKVRGEICAEWNLSPSDFPGVKEYNDYLEQRETVIAGELRDPDSVKALRKQHVTKHRDAIARNKVWHMIA